jgi:hypothetical protein
MRRLSAVLMGLGVALGAGISVAMLLHLGIPGDRSGHHRRGMRVAPDESARAARVE